MFQQRAPNGIRTRATALKGRRPGPLDDEGGERLMLLGPLDDPLSIRDGARRLQRAAGNPLTTAAPAHLTRIRSRTSNGDPAAAGAPPSWPRSRRGADDDRCACPAARPAPPAAAPPASRGPFCRLGLDPASRPLR